MRVVLFWATPVR